MAHPDPRHAPSPDLEGHLTFALKYEGLDLAVLKRRFATVAPAEIEAIVRTKPTGSYFTADLVPL
jgi:hypothetical protein